MIWNPISEAPKGQWEYITVQRGSKTILRSVFLPDYILVARKGGDIPRVSRWVPETVWIDGKSLPVSEAPEGHTGRICGGYWEGYTKTAPPTHFQELPGMPS